MSQPSELGSQDTFNFSGLSHSRAKQSSTIEVLPKDSFYGTWRGGGGREIDGV